MKKEVRKVKTDIIPIEQKFITIDTPKTLDKKAICCFAATGFFLEDDTYWNNQKVLKPGHNYELDKNGKIKQGKPYFKWHYNPRDISFQQTLDEFENLFEAIIHEQTSDKKVILPLSGGLDSRTQAVALANHPNVQAYSYSFHNGYPEHKIGEKIANALGFPFQKFEVPNGYLWNYLEKLAEINQCYSDFTSPRQMAFLDQYTKMGEVFSLGHWGDVLFDGFGDRQLTEQEELKWIYKKIVKKGGLEFAEALWKDWGIQGDFKEYFRNRIKSMFKAIEIDNSSAKLRAFKSLYWAPRWTSINLQVFEQVTPITVPYYDNRVCEFICTVPEEYLKDRKLQIAYIQRNSKKVANITWHQQKPFNLNNYHWNKIPYNLPYRIWSKLNREGRGFFGKPHIARNWELQFLGKDNSQQLEQWLFESGLTELLSKNMIEEFYNNFKNQNSVYYSHAINMLLVLALIQKKI